MASGDCIFHSNGETYIQMGLGEARWGNISSCKQTGVLSTTVFGQLHADEPAAGQKTKAHTTEHLVDNRRTRAACRSLRNFQTEELVALHCKARQRRAFDIADKIRSMLLKNGVHSNALDSSPLPRHTPPLHVISSEQDIAVVQRMLANRQRLRSVHRFKEADDIRLRLYDVYGVSVDDGRNTWQCATADGRWLCGDVLRDDVSISIQK